MLEFLTACNVSHPNVRWRMTGGELGFAVKIGRRNEEFGEKNRI